ncbi:MAG: toll/interleukin-1 receptor domain-containing protein [Actinobacteria bacterium]|nr:toll/interleukin-1 receptor domain-containing protein [Actinomycetota bacterium]
MNGTLFVSYAHEDSEIVDELAAILDDNGVEYFLDSKDPPS